jgi:microcystin-dependent protein
MTWDKTVPLGSESKSLGDDRLRELKTDLEDALSSAGVFPGPDTSAPIFEYRGGKGDEASRPAAGNSGLYFNEDKNELQRDNATLWEGIGSLLPPGVIFPYGGTAAPGGYLLCDGSTVSRTTYAALYAIVGNKFGSGDNATTFHLPDVRGRFMRFADNGAGRDPDAAARTAMNAGGDTGDSVGSIQDDATAKNSLALTDPGHIHTYTLQTLGLNVPGGATASTTPSGSSNTASNTTGVTLGAGDSETRPLNFTVNAIIKYWGSIDWTFQKTPPPE